MPTPEEIKALDEKIKAGLDNYFVTAFGRKKLFYVYDSPEGGRKYVSPIAIERGDRTLFVKTTKEEYERFLKENGDTYRAEHLQQGDCVCDIRQDAAGNTVEEYLRFDPEKFGAVLEQVPPTSIYSSVEEFRHGYYGE